MAGCNVAKSVCVGVTVPSLSEHSLHRLHFLPRITLLIMAVQGVAWANPANKKALANHLEHFLPAKLTDCTLCHLPSANHAPENLEEFPHNAFGKALAALGKNTPVSERLRKIAQADSDADGMSNLTEILLGGHPGDANVKPASKEGLTAKEQALAALLKRYSWEPFKPVKRPALPMLGILNPVDAFIQEQLSAHGLKPLGEASAAQLARRIYVDLIGLLPTPRQEIGRAHV